MALEPWFPWLPQSYGATLGIGFGAAFLVLIVLYLFLAVIAADRVPDLKIGPGSHVIVTGGSSGTLILFIIIYNIYFIGTRCKSFRCSLT
jgi:hypothetical protein